MTEAVSQLQKGLHLLISLPDVLSRQQQELDLLIALGRALIATKGYSAPDVGETLARARELAEELDRPDYLVSLLSGQFVFHLVRAEHRLALSHAEQVEKIGEARNDVAVLLLGHQYHGVACFFLGEFVAARALFDRCHGLSDPVHRSVHAALAPEDSFALVLAYLAQDLSVLGCIDQARARINEALSEARQLQHAHTLTQVLTRACGVEWVANSPHQVQQRAADALTLSVEHSFPHWLGWGMIYSGWSLTTLGQAQEGVTLLTKGLSVHRAAGSLLSTPPALMMLAEAHAKLGRPAESLDSLGKAVQVIEATDERYIEAELHRLRGDLLGAMGDRAAAEQSYHRALAVAERQSAKLFELRAATGLARLWRDQGKRTEARDLLAPVYGWFTEGFDTPVLQEAKALLDERT
jgi:predicted ATPase